MMRPPSLYDSLLGFLVPLCRSSDSPARLWLADCRWRARRRPGTKEATTDDHSHLMLASCLSVAHASLPPSLASDRHEMGMKGRSRCHAFSSSSQFTRWLATLSHLIQGRSDRDRRERGTTGRDETRPAVTNGEWLVVTVPLIPHSFVIQWLKLLRIERLWVNNISWSKYNMLKSFVTTSSFYKRIIILFLRAGREVPVDRRDMSLIIFPFCCEA